MGSRGEWVSGNIFIRPNRLEKTGNKVNGHCHNFDHTTIVFSGAVRVIGRKSLPVLNEDGTPMTKDGSPVFHRVQIADGIFGDHPDAHGRHFLVLANVEHEIVALADNTEFWCVYSHRTPQGEVSVQRTGWEKAYG